MSAWDAIVFVLGKLWTLVVNPNFVWTAGGLGLIVAACFAFDVARGRAWRRYLSRTFVTDLAWTVFYAGGLYYFFFSGPVDRAMAAGVLRFAPWLRLDLLSVLPQAAHWFVIIAITDGINYWTHRWSHSWGWLWCFHCVHHTPAAITPLTRFRIHFGDMLFFGVVKFVPLMLLGLAPRVWLPVALLTVFLQAVAHADVDWGYGWIGRILVSPRFHRVHHATDPALQNTNFGIIFSCWDYLMGTAAARMERPAAYGLLSPPAPESFLGQLALPFLLLARRAGAPTPAAAAPEAAE